MANISEADGRFKVLGAENIEKEEVFQLLSMIKQELEVGDYDTCLHCNLADVEPDVDSFIKDNYESPFFGAGRWFYEYNIKSMVEWIMYSWNFDKKELQLNKKYAQLINKIIEKNIQFQFDFYDFESGQAPYSIFKEYYLARPYFDEKDQLYKTEIIESDSEECLATGNQMVEYGYIEDFYTLEEMKRNESEYFADEDHKHQWFEVEENEGCFENGKYVFAPDKEMFFLA